jgi:L-ectoine synthase
MIVRTLDEILKSKRYIKTPAGESRRFLLKEDGMGFSLTDAIVREGGEATFCFKNHLEAQYVIEGEGEIEVLEPEHKIIQIRPGTMFAWDKHDRFRIRVTKRIRQICVFNPPLKGPEVEDADGSYPLLD